MVSVAVDVAAELVADSRSRLLDAATRLVGDMSYHSVGVTAICDRAGVHRGSFYHHFSSKRDLMIAVLDVAAREFEEQVLAGCRDTTVSPKSQLESVVDRLHDRQLRDRQETGHVRGCLFGNLAAESAATDAVVRERISRFFADFETALEMQLNRARLRGEIPESVRATEVVASLEGLLLMARLGDDPDVVADGGRALIDRLWRTGPHDSTPDT